MAAGETKLSLLNPYIGSLPDGALLYIVVDGVSYKATKADLLAGIIGGNLFTQLIAIGATTIDGNDITIAAGTMGQLGASVYTTTSPQTFTVPFSSAGKVRTDIIVLNTSSVLVLVSGTEGDIAVQPAIPANTILVTKIEVAEDGIGAVPEPTYLTIDERAAITYANAPSEENPFATINDLNRLPVEIETTYTTQTIDKSRFLFVLNIGVTIFIDGDNHEIGDELEIYNEKPSENLTIVLNSPANFAQGNSDFELQPFCKALIKKIDTNFWYYNIVRVENPSTPSLKEILAVEGRMPFEISSDYTFESTNKWETIIINTASAIDLFLEDSTFVTGDEVEIYNKLSANARIRVIGLESAQIFYKDEIIDSDMLNTVTLPLYSKAWLKCISNFPSIIFELVIIEQSDFSGYATEAYVDNKVAGLLDLRGSHDCSGNVFPTTGGSGTAGAILKGDFWFVSVAGFLNGVKVEVGDSFFALNDSPTSSQWQILESNLGYVPENSANKTDTMAGNTASSIKYLSAKGVFDYIASVLVNATASVRGIVKLYTSTGNSTDGTMDRNSITNALDLKADKNKVETFIYSKSGGTYGSHTGTTAETVLLSVDISAGEFVVGDIINYIAFIEKPLINGTATIRVRAGVDGTTSDSLIATSSAGSNTDVSNYIERTRHQFLSGNILKVFRNNTAVSSDRTITSRLDSVSLNFSSAWKLTFTIQLSNALDEAKLTGYRIGKIKTI